MVGGRSLEDDYVLKQAFSALIPAFDPRPGRTNVPQIQDFHVPSPGSDVPTTPSNQTQPSTTKGIKLALSIRVRVHSIDLPIDVVLQGQSSNGLPLYYSPRV